MSASRVLGYEAVTSPDSSPAGRAMGTARGRPGGAWIRRALSSKPRRSVGSCVLAFSALSARILERNGPAPLVVAGGVALEQGFKMLGGCHVSPLNGAFANGK